MTASNGFFVTQSLQIGNATIDSAATISNAMSRHCCMQNACIEV